MTDTAHVPRVRTLVVGPADPTEHARTLEGLALVEARRASPDEAAAAVATSPDLSLVVVDGVIGESAGAALVTSLRKDDPGLRIVWLGPGAQTLGSFGPAPPDRILPASIGAHELEQALRTLLRFDLYPPPIVRTLCDATTTTLEDAFHSPTQACGTFVKANRLMLATTSAILPFSGTKLSGWCLVGGEAEALTGVRARTLKSAGPPTEADLEDLAGELANHIVGHLKRWLALQDLKVSNGTPILMHGTAYKLREKGGLPSAVARPELADGHLFVQLTLDPGCELVLKDPDARVLRERSSFELLT